MNLVFLLAVVSPRARERKPIAVIDGLERQLVGRSRLIGYRDRFNATAFPGAGAPSLSLPLTLR